mmetsp:Transcript_13591/g.27032  ORF Transcript_13591/g.27032 Transcript_13591/m.27032 type:complete len:249 (+) Transcript_13591:138-884(+)
MHIQPTEPLGEQHETQDQRHGLPRRGQQDGGHSSKPLDQGHVTRDAHVRQHGVHSHVQRHGPIIIHQQAEIPQRPGEIRHDRHGHETEEIAPHRHFQPRTPPPKQPLLRIRQNRIGDDAAAHQRQPRAVQLDGVEAIVRQGEENESRADGEGAGVLVAREASLVDDRGDEHGGDQFAGAEDDLGGEVDVGEGGVAEGGGGEEAEGQEGVGAEGGGVREAFFLGDVDAFEVGEEEDAGDFGVAQHDGAF